MRSKLPSLEVHGEKSTTYESNQNVGKMDIEVSDSAVF
jgi:hypothetical protein